MKRNLSGEPRRKVKRRRDEHVLCNIVSLRISDQEKQFIEKVTRESSRSVSDVVREAIEFWMDSHKQLCLE